MKFSTTIALLSGVTAMAMPAASVHIDDAGSFDTWTLNTCDAGAPGNVRRRYGGIPSDTCLSDLTGQRLQLWFLAQPQCKLTVYESTTCTGANETYTRANISNGVTQCLDISQRHSYQIIC